MLRAMMASVGAEGMWTTSRVASASVMLCATVNAVTAFKSGPRPFTIKSRANTNKR